MTHPPLKFLRPWRGRVAGDIDTALDFGVAQLLVQRGIAAWALPQKLPRKRPPQPEPAPEPLTTDN